MSSRGPSVLDDFDIGLREVIPHKEKRVVRIAGEGVSMRYLVIVEEGRDSFGAHVPDLPGCIAAGRTRTEVLSLIQEAITLHLEDLRESGQAIPAASSSSEIVEVKAA